MERLLLNLYQLKERNLSQKELSNYLEISQRQLSRNLERWTEEKLLIYKSGNGRGNKTAINWYVNIEEDYYSRVERMLSKGEITDAMPYLTWEWSEQFKQQLIHKSNQLLGYRKLEDNKEKLVITKRFKIFSTMPYEALDAKSISILSSVYERLFNIDEDGNIHPALVHHYELFEHHLNLYLRPAIKFHDESILKSDDIINCLNYAREHYNTEDLLAPVTSIDKLGELSLKIGFDHFPDIIQVLSYSELSIYKERSGQFIGNGPYYISKNTEYITTLDKFDAYFGYSAYIDTIEMINLPENRYISIGDPNKEKCAVSRKLGFHYLCKTYDCQLTKEQLTYIHYIINEYYRYKLNKVYTVSLDRPIILQSSKYPLISEIKKPVFDVTVKINCIGIGDIRYKILKDLLNMYDVPVEITYLDFNNETNRLDYSEVDFVCFGEYLELPEDSSYYHFIFNQKSSIHNILKTYPEFEELKAYYLNAPYSRWRTLNKIVDRRLFKESILFPIYNNQMILNYEENLEGISINAMGFIDLHKVWKKQ